MGKLEGSETTAARSWRDLDALLEGRPSAPNLEPPGLGRKSPDARWREASVSEVRAERLRRFGWVYLGLALWRRLGLHTFLRERLEPGRGKEAALLQRQLDRRRRKLDQERCPPDPTPWPPRLFRYMATRSIDSPSLGNRGG